MEELFKERREKLNILKNLRRKPKEEKKVSNTSSVPEGLYTKCPECEQGYLSEDVQKNFMSVPAADIILRLPQRIAFKCWWTKTAFGKLLPD